MDEKYYSHSGKLAQHIKGHTTVLHDKEINFTDTGKPDSKERISNGLHLQEVYKHCFTVKELGKLIASAEEEGDWGVLSLSILIQRISEPRKCLTRRESTENNPKRQTRGSSCSWLQGWECRIKTVWKASGSVSPSSVAWVPDWFQQSRHPGRCQCAYPFCYRPSYHKSASTNILVCIFGVNVVWLWNGFLCRRLWVCHILVDTPKHVSK